MSENAALDLGRYIDAAPSPYHAAACSMALLAEAGFQPLLETDRWPDEPGRYMVLRGGSLVAWSTEHLENGWRPGTAFTVVGGHTDSPNLRLKPMPGYTGSGWDMLGVEVYGGPLLPTWFDRDLGLSGRVAVRDESVPAGYQLVLFSHDEPLLRVANLAIHLDRGAGDGSAAIDRQHHLAPLWGITGTASFTEWLAEHVGVRPSDVLSFEAMTHDLTPSTLLGHAGDLLAAPRLDNLGSAFAATAGLIRAVHEPASAGPARVAATGDGLRIPVVALFDHEEIGSETSSGARSQLLDAVLERVVHTHGGDRVDSLAATSASLVVSADMSHAVHPNRPDRNEPRNRPVAGGGPVLKVNAQGRYATDSPGAAAFVLACERVGLTPQVYVHRTDLPCGSTVGPATAARLGATTVDVGAAILSMHSSRELMAMSDVGSYVRALGSVLGADIPTPGLVV